MKNFHFEKNTHKIEEFYRIVHKANEAYFTYWKEHTFLHWDWWLSVGLTVLPWVIWWRWTDKANRARFMFTAFFIVIVCSWFDFCGVALGLWYYAGKVIPTIPSYAPWDFALFPVTMTLLIQFRPHISPLKKAIFYGLMVAFIGEPIFEWTGLYTKTHWQYSYSFPIYMLIYLSANWVSKRESFGTV